jgi:hypothetical protein
MNLYWRLLILENFIRSSKSWIYTGGCFSNINILQYKFMTYLILWSFPILTASSINSSVCPFSNLFLYVMDDFKNILSKNKKLKDLIYNFIREFDYLFFLYLFFTRQWFLFNLYIFFSFSEQFKQKCIPIKTKKNDLKWIKHHCICSTNQS